MLPLEGLRVLDLGAVLMAWDFLAKLRPIYAAIVERWLGGPPSGPSPAETSPAKAKGLT